MSVEEELAVSSLILVDQRECIEDLKQLVRDYDQALAELMPHVYRHWKQPKMLREKARQEGINIQEPL